VRDVNQIIDEMTAEIRRLRRWSDHIHRDLDIPAFDLDRLAAVKKRLDEMRPWLSVADPRDDEITRLRDALADERAGRCADQLDLVGARSLLAEQTARAESAEAERDAAVEGKAEVFFAAEDRERFEATIARLRAALAAGPAALRALVDRGETLPVLADLVEAAQRRAMEEGDAV
jgi:hypothetical protein